MNAYCQKALQVLQDQHQTWHAKWIAAEILSNAGYTRKEISLLQCKHRNSPYGSICA